MIAFIPSDHLLLTLFGSMSQSFGGRYYTDFCLDDSIGTVLPLIVLHLSPSTDSLIRTPFTVLLSIAAKCHWISPYRNWQSELELTTKTKNPVILALFDYHATVAHTKTTDKTNVIGFFNLLYVMSVGVVSSNSFRVREIKKELKRFSKII